MNQIYNKIIFNLKMKKSIHSWKSGKPKALLAATGLALFAVAGTTSVQAKTDVPDDAFPMIVVPHQQEVSYRERTLCVDVDANVPYTMATDETWVSLREGSDGTVYMHVGENYSNLSRTATVTFTSEDAGIVQQMSITQTKNESVNDIADTEITPSSASDNSHYSGSSTEGDVYLSIDGNTSTMFHSSYAGGVSASNPVVLTYNFTNVDRIDYINYVPRSGDSSNGNFGEVEVYVKCEGDADYTLYGSYDWEMLSTVRTVTFTDGLLNPTSIRFRVLTGRGGFASCVEMQFRAYNQSYNASDYDIFADDVYSELKEGTTEDDIAQLSNPFVKYLANLLINGDYDKEYRVAEYPCHLSPTQQSENWNCPGKYYDQFAGVTGINISKGTQAVIVSGIPDDISVQLKVVAWFAGELDDDGVGTGPATYTYALKNGINTIDYTSDYDGLAYISYYTTGDPADYPDIKVHIVDGEVNGYLSPDKTNEDMYLLCVNAPNTCMDLVGDRVHSVWTSSGLAKYCKASDGSSLGYVQYINLLDTLVAWEHRLLGLEKYDRLPDNRTMAYVNYTYYMFQGSYGVSFMYNQESRVLNCRRLMYSDSDAIWGLSHEWGHQHQMTPYFCWSGQSECTNNMNSCYNVLHMGYSGSSASRIQGEWTDAYEHFFEHDLSDSGDFSVTESTQRPQAYENKSRFSWNSKILEELEAQYDEYYIDGVYNIPSYLTDSLHGLSILEVYVEEHLAPYFMLYCYFSDNSHADYTADFQEDLYESLRQNDEDNGSSVEPEWVNGVKTAKTSVDKYELLASAQNGNVNGAYAKFIAAYPQSAWTTNKYITSSSTYTENSVPFMFNYVRKASKLCGYNLYPFFEKFGFFRTVIMTINDYGYKDFALMEDMLAEFKADMEALNLKTVDDEMMESISHSSIPTFSTPTIPNTPTTR